MENERRPSRDEGTKIGDKQPRLQKESSRVAVEEALLLAQSRAREAEDVLCRYDVKMEEAVLKALTMLDRSRDRQTESLQRVRALEHAVLAEERELHRL
eukprot:CAMPEP_0196740232 /NCGR_PEP_ID=MMETSP1091-20130531/30372_1 /TAXON_ID=302021 /ORGANISM="Rhodomonas sp., Strain CCMP768" /LENGTH=98 /DNA_ID=CAMNT_0042085259 /DNA_START=130 /DNA_END=423 /DNA_ORIENTATION=-